MAANASEDIHDPALERDLRALKWELGALALVACLSVLGWWLAVGGGGGALARVAPRSATVANRLEHYRAVRADATRGPVAVCAAARQVRAVYQRQGDANGVRQWSGVVRRDCR